MLHWSRNLAVAVLAALFGVLPVTAKAQQLTKVIIALPAPTLTFSSPFLALDAGFYKKQGLDVEYRMLVGVEAVNAVIAGSADFTVSTGPVFLRAAAKGQPLYAIVNLIDRPLVEMVLRKDVYQSLHITPQMTLAQRAHLLKGTTIAIQGVGSIIHAWERLVVVRGGLDPETDVRIAPMDPPAMLGALQTKAVDGFTTSLPFTTQAVMDGSAVMFASAPDGAAPDLIPFPYGLVMGKKKTCETERQKCAGVVRALAEANQMIINDPQKALGIIRHRFAHLDPKVLETAWKTVAAAHAKDLRINDALLDTAERVNIEAKLLDPKDRVKSFKGLYTNQYIPKADQ